MNLATLVRLLVPGLTWAWIAPAQAETPFVDPMFEFTVKKDVVFAQGNIGHPETTGQMDLRLNLYRPVATDQLPATLPAVIFGFGGGYKKGSKNIGYIRDLCEHYAKRGYVVAAIDYRLIQHEPSAVKNPIPNPPGLSELGRVVNAAVQDTANSIRWLKENAAELKIDPNRIVVGGVSAGALNALFAGHAEADTLGPNADVAAVICLMGPAGMEPDMIDADDPPTFFAHGEKDWPMLMIDPYVRQLDQVKVYNELFLAPGLGHRITPILDTEIEGKTIRDHSIDFCFQALRLSELIAK